MRSTPDITPHLGSLLKFRHDLHAHPELRYEEHRTGDKVAAYLQALGLQVHRLKPRMRPGRLPSGDRSLSELVFHWGSGLASTCCSVRLLFGACLHSFGGTQAGRTGRPMHPSRSQGRLALADAALLESFQPLIVGPGAGELAQMCAR